MRSLLLLSILAAGLAAAAQPLLTPEEAVRIALENNHGVRIARTTAEIARVGNNPGAAGMLPSVNALGTYSVDNASTRQELFTGEIRQADNANTKVLSGEVELDWRLFDGLAMFASKDRLEALERIGQTQLRQQLEATTYDVLAAYYQLVQLENAVDVQREGMHTSRERLHIAETGRTIGSYSGLDVVQARLDLSTDSAQLLALAQQVSMARTALNTLLARDPGTGFAVDTVIPVTDVPELAALRQAAQGDNSTVQQAREQRIVADLTVKQLRGALLPTLDGFANYGYARTTSEVGLLKINERTGPQYGLTLSVPLFRGGAVKALKQAQLSGQAAELTLEQAQLQLERDLLDTWTAHRNALQRVALEEDNLSGVRTQMQVALESYRIGAITAIQLREVQQGLIAANNRLLLAQYEAKLAELQLNWLAGELI